MKAGYVKKYKNRQLAKEYKLVCMEIKRLNAINNLKNYKGKVKPIISEKEIFYESNLKILKDWKEKLKKEHYKKKWKEEYNGKRI